MNVIARNRGIYYFRKEEQKMKDLMNWFSSEESGQGLVEYGLIIALIAVVLIASLTSLGTGIQAKFQQIIDALK